MTSSSKKPTAEHASCILLSAEANKKFISLLEPRTQALCTGFVSVLLSRPPKHPDWKWTHTGLATLIKDHNRKSYYVQIYDIVDWEKAREEELSKGKAYQVSLPKFHQMETAKGHAMGLKFSDETEAKAFAQIARAITMTGHYKTEGIPPPVVENKSDETQNQLQETEAQSVPSPSSNQDASQASPTSSSSVNADSSTTLSEPPSPDKAEASLEPSPSSQAVNNDVSVTTSPAPPPPPSPIHKAPPTIPPRPPQPPAKEGTTSSRPPTKRTKVPPPRPPPSLNITCAGSPSTTKENNSQLQPPTPPPMKSPPPTPTNKTVPPSPTIKEAQIRTHLPSPTSPANSTGTIDKRKAKKKITKSMIGTPTNFQHLSHIGFDPDVSLDEKTVQSIMSEPVKRPTTRPPPPPNRRSSVQFPLSHTPPSNQPPQEAVDSNPKKHQAETLQVQEVASSSSSSVDAADQISSGNSHLELEESKNVTVCDKNAEVLPSNDSVEETDAVTSQELASEGAKPQELTDTIIPLGDALPRENDHDSVPSGNTHSVDLVEEHNDSGNQNEDAIPKNNSVETSDISMDEQANTQDAEDLCQNKDNKDVNQPVKDKLLQELQTVLISGDNSLNPASSASIYTDTSKENESSELSKEILDSLNELETMLENVSDAVPKEEAAQIEEQCESKEADIGEPDDKTCVAQSYSENNQEALLDNEVSRGSADSISASEIKSQVDPTNSRQQELPTDSLEETSETVAL